MISYKIVLFKVATSLQQNNNLHVKNLLCIEFCFKLTQQN